jgi:hypothetical protein
LPPSIWWNLLRFQGPIVLHATIWEREGRGGALTARSPWRRFLISVRRWLGKFWGKIDGWSMFLQEGDWNVLERWEVF